ncbi:MAG TPA: phospholipase D family protein [Planctomycetota bacterium]
MGSPRAWHPPRTAAWVLALASASGCVYPSRSWRPEESHAWARPEETTLGKHVAEQAAKRPGLSVLYPLPSGLDALAARLVLIERAERAIDFQYYILHDDVTGKLVVARLLAAAERGVRVRVLVDDLGSPDLDAWMPALDVHPDIEVRYFNPLARGPLPKLARALDSVGRLRRINHRMHNKLLAVDGIAGVVGGRNVGDEYFDAAEGVNFADYDLLVGGPVAQELGESFDQYWNSPYAVGVVAWKRLRRDTAALEALRVELEAHVAAQAGGAYADRLRGAALLEQLTRGEASAFWASAHAVADLPEKVVAFGDEIEATLLIRRAEPYLGRPERELLISSPYFVPGDKGVAHLVGLVRAGVRVVVLTNALAATDVPIVHAGYKRYRHELLAGGVELYELRPRGAALEQARKAGLFGSSGASLHAKTFVYDRRRVFVGSLNLDPRSVDLNTELGVVVASEDLAAEVVASFERATSPELSWRLSLDEDGDLVWEAMDEGVPMRRTSEPDTSAWQRFRVWCLGWLPIESQI